MTISIIRKYTEQDRINVENAAIRFCTRHNINYDYFDSAYQAIDAEIYLSNDKALRYNWQRCLCRALNVTYDRRITTAYGYVGYSIN